MRKKKSRAPYLRGFLNPVNQVIDDMIESMKLWEVDIMNSEIKLAAQFEILVAKLTSDVGTCFHFIHRLEICNAEYRVKINKLSQRLDELERGK